MSSAEIASKIPILTGASMYKGSFTDPTNPNKHCLLGHQQRLPSEIAGRMYRTLIRMVKLRTSHGNVPTFNDKGGLSLDALADFWNQARRRVIQAAWRADRKAQGL